MAAIAQTVSSAVQNLIDLVSADTEAICKDAQGQSVTAWREWQITKATAIGGGAAIIPVAGYLTLPADILATLRIMHRAATGISYIELGHADDQTFAGILAVWSGAVTLDENLARQMTAKALAASAGVVGGQAGVHLAIHAFNLCTSALLTKKLGPKVAQKVAAKLSKKLAAKAGTRWIPFISAIASGGANWWIVSGVCDAAVEYAAFIKRNSPAR